MAGYRETDALIFGGGAAGLWTLNSLVSHGYDALLVENAELGRGQTIATQGIIHGGGKYILFDSKGASSFAKRWASMETVRDMPAIWDKHFDSSNKDLPNLSQGVKQSDGCYFYRSVNDSGFWRPLAFECLSRFALQTPLERIAVRDAPGFLAKSARRIYFLRERTVEARSLLHSLASPFSERIIYSDSIIFEHDRVKVRDRFDRKRFNIKPKVIILAAGSGNEFLAGMFGIRAEMQRRPLRQAYIGHPELPDFQAHCIDGQQTRATFTTHPSRTYEKVWQIGGTIAEAGVKQEKDEFERHIKDELSKILPGFNIPKDAYIGFFDVDRAEPATSEGQRPSGIGLHKQVIDTQTGLYALVAFPTKLVMAPQLAREVESEMVSLGTFPDLRNQRAPFKARTPVIAKYPWDED